MIDRTSPEETTWPQLHTLRCEAPTDEILAAMDRDGACIVADVLSTELRARIDDEVAPLLARASLGPDDFTGRQTARIGALVARSPACCEVVMHPLALTAAETFLLPFCSRIQLHLTQLIHIRPGQGAQPLHRDRLAWCGYLPDAIEPQFNTIWALTDFTADNGATLVGAA